MTDKIRVLLIYGGKSGEHEVSLVSAASVLTNLDKEKYQPILLAMDKQGGFHLHQAEDIPDGTKQLPVKTERSQPVDALMLKGKLSIDADVVFPVVHGPLYEDGCLQGLLRLMAVPFVGSDVLASAAGMDKDISRRLAALVGWSSPDYLLLSSFASAEQKQTACQEAVKRFQWPIFVKPCSLGSSVGIHKVESEESLISAVNDACRYDEMIMIEQGVDAREIELSVLESQPGELPAVSLPGEIRVSKDAGFYSYDAKYVNSAQSELLAPAPLSDELTEQFQQAAVEIFQALKCQGMARVDFFLEQGSNKIIFNEINTLPGFTSISMYPRLWQVSGKPYRQLLDELIQLALDRQQRREQIVTDYL